MQKYEDALELAKTMVDIGEGAGKRVVALITSMEQPLGYAIGNAIEVKEAIDTLSGNGPQDLVDLIMELGSNMLIRRNIETKKGLEKLKELIQAQGGNPEVVDEPSLLPQPKQILEVKSKASGYVEKIDALEVGLASKVLGAGRKTKDEPVDLSIGIYLKKKVGDKVEQGEPLALFYSDGDKEKIESAEKRFINAYTIGENKVDSPRFFYARVSKEGVDELK
jgi:pyrimidine-nucleoside phosphorylase